MKKTRTAQSGFFSLNTLIRVFAYVAAAFCMVSATLLAFFTSEAPTKVYQRTLTFAERVAYQRAIEEVYWRHRIWPKERPDPKPSLDAMISPVQLEKKVADYLRKSQTLEDYWQRPITAEQLQAEMDRMAKNTKQPEVLRELFEVLGNDPFVLAECLARPVLAERLSSDFVGQHKPAYSKFVSIGAPWSMSIAVTAANGAYGLPTVSEGDTACIDDTWTATTITDAPFRRNSPTAVWTGSEMIVWGGVWGYITLNTGGRYNPATDNWTATSTIDAPSERYLHAAVWTGSEMVIWGGASVLLGGELNTGGRYNPSTDSWTATSLTNAPPARYYHTGIWSGSEMIVWGGYSGGYGGHQLNTGGRYHPVTNSWTATSMTNVPPAREEHTAVWTGSEMIVWGGYLFDGISHWWNTGGRYNPALDTWAATSTTSAPTGRRFHTAVWTGDAMIVWGGQDENFGQLNTGGRYYPAWDAWIATTIVTAPSARDSHTAIWTGNEMIVWGGYPDSSYVNAAERYWTQTAPPTGQTPSPTPSPIPTPVPPGTGGRYDPSTDSWTATTTTGAPTTRFDHAAVWTGSEMIVWGGHTLGYFDEWDTGGRYCAQLGPTPTPTPTATPAPTARHTPTPRPRLTPAPRPTR